MIVTLYKNCKLNAKYKDIFYNKTFLNNYLSSLTNVTVLNDNNIFSRNEDKLVIDEGTITDFKQYNYMKIQDGIGTFYAFINNIKWINEMYIINYSEDIMSNYIEDIHIRNSLLTGCRSLALYKGANKRNINYFDVPIQPKSNNYINFEPYNILESKTTGDYVDHYAPEMCLVGKLQLYKLGTAGSAGKRQPIIAILGRRVFSQEVGDYILVNSFNNVEELDKTIEYYLDGANSLTISEYGGDTDWVYEIDKLYVIPKSMITYKEPPYNQTTDTLYIAKFGTQSTDVRLIMYPLTQKNNVIYVPQDSFDKQLGLNNTYTKTFNYDRKIDSIGTFSSPIKVINNGTNIEVKIITYIKYYAIKITLNMQNKIVDITDEFIVDLPYTKVNASELQLQRLQVDLQENTIKNKIDNINLDIEQRTATGIISFASNIASGLTKTVGSVITGNIAGAVNGISDAIFGSANTAVNSLYEIEKNKNDIKYSSERINLINQKMYCNSSISQNKFSYFNGMFGLCVFRIVEDNTQQIEQAINLNGYLVREVVGDIIKELDTANLSNNYEVLKFDEVNVYGVIAQDYIEIIEAVLMKGVRIWCQNTIGDIINV